MNTSPRTGEEAAHSRAFLHYLRTGEQLTTAQYKAKYERKFNPYHDPENGRFTFAPGGTSGGLGFTREESSRQAGTVGARHAPSPTPTPTQVRSPIRGVTTYPPGSPLAQSPRNPGLTDSVVAAARKAQREFGVPASITIAQYALESGWGKRMPPNSNNPFGIKARPGEPFVETTTWEQDRTGRKFVVKAKFRKFNSIGEAFAAHAQLLQNPVYARAQAARTSADYADALTGVYATDHQYGNKLKSIMRRNGLEHYDSK